MDLADRALRAAGRRRATTIGAAFGTGAVAVALVAVGVAGLSGPGDGTAPPAQAATATPEPCVAYTSGSNGLAEVPSDQWPDFVTAAVAALPARSDYSMQSGYAWCDLPPGANVPEVGGWKIGRAIINLGRNREHGVLPIEIYIRVPQQPTTCTEVSAGVVQDSSFFCTPGTPLTYGYGPSDSPVVIAVYGGGVEVRMPYHGDTLTAQQLAAAASDPGLRQTVQKGVAGTPT